MTHTVNRREVEEWEEEVCDECGHPVSEHYNEPREVKNTDGSIMYIALGCMSIFPRGTGRILPNNPYRRCPCMHSK
jgi:hypothetical protein